MGTLKLRSFVRKHLSVITVSLPFVIVWIINLANNDLGYILMFIVLAIFESLLIDFIVNKKAGDISFAPVMKLCPLLSVIIILIIPALPAAEERNFVALSLMYIGFCVLVLPFFFMACSKETLLKNATRALYYVVLVALVYFFLLTQSLNVYLGAWGVFFYLLLYYLTLFSVSCIEKDHAALRLSLISAVLLFLLQINRDSGGGGIYFGLISFNWDWLLMAGFILISVVNVIASSVYIFTTELQE